MRRYRLLLLVVAPRRLGVLHSSSGSTVSYPMRPWPVNRQHASFLTPITTDTLHRAPCVSALCFVPAPFKASILVGHVLRAVQTPLRLVVVVPTSVHLPAALIAITFPPSLILVGIPTPLNVCVPIVVCAAFCSFGCFVFPSSSRVVPCLLISLLAARTCCGPFILIAALLMVRLMTSSRVAPIHAVFVCAILKRR